MLPPDQDSDLELPGSEAVTVRFMRWNTYMAAQQSVGKLYTSSFFIVSNSAQVLRLVEKTHDYAFGMRIASRLTFGSRKGGKHESFAICGLYSLGVGDIERPGVRGYDLSH